MARAQVINRSEASDMNSTITVRGFDPRGRVLTPTQSSPKMHSVELSASVRRGHKQISFAPSKRNDCPLAWRIDRGVVTEMAQPPVVALFNSLANHRLDLASVIVWEALEGIARLAPRQSCTGRLPRGGDHARACPSNPERERVRHPKDRDYRPLGSGAVISIVRDTGHRPRALPDRDNEPLRVSGKKLQA